MKTTIVILLLAIAGPALASTENMDAWRRATEINERNQSEYRQKQMLYETKKQTREMEQQTREMQKQTREIEKRRGER